MASSTSSPHQIRYCPCRRASSGKAQPQVGSSWKAMEIVSVIAGTSAAVAARTFSPEFTTLRVRIPVLQLGEGVVRGASHVPARDAPALEVQVAALGVAGGAHLADLLPGRDAGPDGRPARRLEVHVDEVGPGEAPVKDDVVARAGSLVCVHADRSRLDDVEL